MPIDALPLKRVINPNIKIMLQAEYEAKLAIKKGILARLPCERCGAIKVHGHHDDYRKPLELRWLCPSHHKGTHLKLNSEGLCPQLTCILARNKSQEKLLPIKAGRKLSNLVFSLPSGKRMIRIVKPKQVCPKCKNEWYPDSIYIDVCPECGFSFEQNMVIYMGEGFVSGDSAAIFTDDVHRWAQINTGQEALVVGKGHLYTEEGDLKFRIKNGGGVKKVAKALGMHPKSLYSKLEGYGGWQDGELDRLNALLKGDEHGKKK